MNFAGRFVDADDPAGCDPTAEMSTEAGGDSSPSRTSTCSVDWDDIAQQESRAPEAVPATDEPLRADHSPSGREQTDELDDAPAIDRGEDDTDGAPMLAALQPFVSDMLSNAGVQRRPNRKTRRH